MAALWRPWESGAADRGFVGFTLAVLALTLVVAFFSLRNTLDRPCGLCGAASSVSYEPGP